MTDILSYADALSILGCEQVRLAKAVEQAAAAPPGGRTGVSRPVVGLAELRGEIVRHTEDTIRREGSRRGGGTRFHRTQRLAAAHAVIVVASYVEALDETRLPVKLEQLDHAHHPGAAEAYADLLRKLLTTRLPVPQPHRPYEETRQAVRQAHRRMSEAITAYARLLPVWGELSAADRTRLPALLADGPEAQALRGYDEDYRLLALDCAEFALWSAVSAQPPPGAGLSRVARLLAELAPPRTGDRPVIHLVRLAAGALGQPLMAGREPPDDVRLPLLGEGYITPRCRVAELAAARPAAEPPRPADKDWWAAQRLLPDTEAFLVGHLTSLGATQSPLVVLGEPGAGKSTLLEVLAARLAGSEFLPVRVALRDVLPESTVLSQIDQGLRAVLGEDVHFEELVDAGQGALPVLLLDGFDELIQSAGAGRYDYLEQIQEFQARQYRVGRPVAVVVTGRTVVAGQVGFPEGVVALQLCPFDEDRVRRWLAIWDQANRAPLARRDREPLPAGDALALPELATQPLLLLLLALHDATGGAVRDAGRIGRAQLYESLVREFVRREVTRDASAVGLPPPRLRALVDRELVRLGAVALSMFVRGRPVVAADALDADLAALFGPGVRAERVVRRLFFVRTVPAGVEFAHATFGEFLVAWLTVFAVRELVRRHDLLGGDLSAAPAQDVDDDLLHAITSFSCLAERGPVVGFAVELLAELPAEERERAAELLGVLLRESLHERRRRSFTGFAPVRRTVTRRLAAYSANLLLLTVAASGAPVRVSELFGGPDPLAEWTSHAHLWRGQLGDGGWRGLLTAVPALRVSDGGERDILLGGPAEPPGADGLAWWFGHRLDHRLGQRATVLRHRPHVRAERPYLLSPDADLLADLLPEYGDLALVLRPPGRVTSLPRLLRDLLTGEPPDPGERVTRYLDAIAAIIAPGVPRDNRALALIAHAVTLDGARLPFAGRGRIVSALLHAGADHALLRPVVEAMIAERFESWESLVRAGIPEDVLRKIHSP